MSKNTQPPTPKKNRQDGWCYDSVKGGHNPERFEQRPRPPAKPPEK